MTGRTDDVRTLVLVRHAAAAAAQGSDRDRPLTAAGAHDATELGRWLAARLPGVDAVVCSSALRARETWQHAAVTVPRTPEPRYLDAVYDAGCEDLLDIVATTAPTAAVLVVIGHNPAVEQAADRLTGESAGFRPGAAALILLDRGWDQRSGARVAEFRRTHGS